MADGSKVFGLNERTLNSESFSSVFHVIITSSKNDQVVARLPERVSFRIKSEWDTILNGGVRKFFNIALQETADVSVNNKFTTAQGWTGNAPLEFTLNLEFYAEENVSNEVMGPIAALSKMALPRTSKFGLYKPPGPRLFGDLSLGNLRITEDKGDHISLSIPKLLFLKDIIVVDVDNEFVTRDMHVTGPLRASCNVTFRTLYSFTNIEFDEAFAGHIRA